jgi:hypothetical protein
VAGVGSLGGDALSGVHRNDTNHAYLYQRAAGEGDHEHTQPLGIHVARRGTSRDASHLIRHIVGNRDDQARTAHDIAAGTDIAQLPDRVAGMLDRRGVAASRRRAAFARDQDAAAQRQQRSRAQNLSRSLGEDYGLEL